MTIFSISPILHKLNEIYRVLSKLWQGEIQPFSANHRPPYLSSYPRSWGWHPMTLVGNSSHEWRRVKGQVDVRACDVISRVASRATDFSFWADRHRSPEYAKFWILKIGPLLAEIRPILWNHVFPLFCAEKLHKFESKENGGGDKVWEAWQRHMRAVSDRFLWNWKSGHY